jgi:hypothetical protein
MATNIIIQINLHGEFIFLSGDCPFVELYEVSHDVLVANIPYPSVSTFNMDKFYS